jgi:hypothetical protein
MPVGNKQFIAGEARQGYKIRQKLWLRPYGQKKQDKDIRSDKNYG